MQRRPFLLSLAAAVFGPVACGPRSAPTTAVQGQGLSLATRFRGLERFQALSARASSENWAALPGGERVVSIARALRGTPYVNWTLEIDERIEAPSVNLLGLDCWTAYEIPLAFARMIGQKPAPWQPEDLLAWIEAERYRGGKCDGTYLSRMHYLEEVFYDNQRRGLATNITPSLPGAQRMQRDITDMSNGWRSYRMMRANPNLVPRIAKMERRVSALPVWHVPKARVAAIEPLLRAGDILAITGYWKGSYTSHVGLAVPAPGGTCRFLHATSEHSKGRQVILDARISQYLAENSSRAGVIVCRPRVG
ncbi:MAG: N-acetylmuramoyl-L-alanine amidase-like domain-containing protein [Verrucomicrobiales bacterium]